MARSWRDERPGCTFISKKVETSRAMKWSTIITVDAHTLTRLLRRMRWMRSVFSVGHSSRGALSESLNLPDLWIFRPPPHRLSISCTNLDNSRTDMMNTHTCVGGHCKLSSSTTCHELGEMCDVKQNLDDPSPYWVLARVGLNGWHLSY